jgi:hypothetical protein
MAVCSRRDQDALAAPLNLIGVAEKMGQRLPPHCQSVLAGRLHRLAAHRLEQDRVPRTTVEVNGNVRRAII